MDENQNLFSWIKDTMKTLQQGSINKELYEEVCRYEDDFRKLGIVSSDLRVLLALKERLVFCPDPYSYSICQPERINYIYENFDNPDIDLASKSEGYFQNAVRSYYSVADEYKQKIEREIQLFGSVLDKRPKYNFEIRCDIEDTKLLTDLFLRKNMFPKPIDSYSPLETLFHEYGLYDAYCTNDDGVNLQWKAGLLLESKGKLSKGTTQKIFSNLGLSVEKIENDLHLFRIDKLRVYDIVIAVSENSADNYIRCKVDGMEQEERKLLSKDMPLNDYPVDNAALAVKYYKDILDANRERGLMVADERTLERFDMSDIKRLVDIYRNGVNEQEMFLSKTAAETKIDSFWWGFADSGLNNPLVSTQKEAAFYILGDYIDELCPGMLTDAELIELCKTTNEYPNRGRAEELNLMKLPESFFPIIELSGELDENIIAYVKIMRNIGRITPKSAVQSMEYYLSARSFQDWDGGDVDDYGQPTGGYYHPNINMMNPADKFAPNLISENEWRKLDKLNTLKKNPFIPFGAFKKDRISEVQIYPTRDGSMMIRCMIDGMQQGARELSEEFADVLGRNVGRERLAAQCFGDAFVEGKTYLLQR